jgi:NADH-quinone oxidoreductase subunit L
MESGEALPAGIFGLFPANDFSLIALILGLPLLGAIVNGIWGKRLGKEAVRLMALSAVGISFLLSVVSFLALDKLAHEHQGEHVKLAWTAWEWMRTSGGREQLPVPIDLRFSIDALSGVMMLIVTGVGFLIHLYSSSYMEHDKGYWRFFAYLNLFIFSMLTLILGDNLPVLFVGWEGVGLCSYLLIGFWYDKMPNAAAGKKAFIANRIGDAGLLAGMFLLAYYAGALDWTGIASGAQSLVQPSNQVHVWPLGGGTYTGALSFLQPKSPVTMSVATAVGLALFLGCAGKSAQIPLYVWLPDAMAGPTPVSALIHAATMVTAGIYLVCRLSFVFVLSPFTMMVIACTGVATALLAATIALVQTDIKKVLAYSTVSQLGFMFLGVGVGAFTAGFFHVFTHAFFKACLFLGSGSVIHAMHARIHDDVASQDMRNMGGLRKYMPITFVTFTVATAAIAGFPLLSGFFSKDEILFKAFVNSPIHPFAERLKARDIAVFEWPTWLGPTLYVLGLIAAVMTAFYMTRALVLTFLGEFRGWKIGRPSEVAAEEVAHGHDDHGAHGDDDEHHHHDDLTTPGAPPHESPWPMTVPLIILATFSAAAGFLNAPLFHFEPMEHWLAPVFESATQSGVRVKEGAEGLMWPLAAGGVVAFLVGTGIAGWMYLAKKGEPAKQIAETVPGFYRLLLDKWRVDELYDYTVLAAVESLAETSTLVDKYIVDGILAKVSALVVAGTGTVLRAFQNGVMHVYAAFMVVGIVLTGAFFVTPHAEATVREVGNGDYAITAAPGMGYAYRWDADGDGKPDTEAFGDKMEASVHLEPGTTHVVRLEVRNAFGFHGAKEIRLFRPQAQKLIEVGQN